MSLDELNEQLDKGNVKMGSKVDKERAKKLRLSHMKKLLSNKERAGITLSDEERAKLLLLKDIET